MITVKMWKDINTFQPIVADRLDVDGTVKRIAAVREKSVEEIEEMPVENLLPEFLECVSIVNRAVFAKLDKMPKNADGDGK